MIYKVEARVDKTRGSITTNGTVEAESEDAARLRVIRSVAQTFDVAENSVTILSVKQRGK